MVAHDLERLHRFAHERVGFVFLRYARAAKGALLMASDYEPVVESDYIEDDSVGARINSRAIRAALQRALTTGESVLHVHSHAHLGPPSFSHVDLRALSDLIPSFASVVPGVAHGGLLLSRNCATGRVWLPGTREPVAARVMVVGFPMVLGSCND